MGLTVETNTFVIPVSFFPQGHTIKSLTLGKLNSIYIDIGKKNYSVNTKSTVSVVGTLFIDVFMENCDNYLTFILTDQRQSLEK